MRTAPVLLTSALARDVLLHCTFSTRPQAAASVQWVKLQRGGYRKRLFAYDGSSGQVERVARAEVALAEIPKGEASLLLRNMELRDEGIYLCMVSVASLAAEQTIELQAEGEGRDWGRGLADGKCSDTQHLNLGWCGGGHPV